MRVGLGRGRKPIRKDHVIEASQPKRLNRASIKEGLGGVF